MAWLSEARPTHPPPGFDPTTARAAGVGARSEPAPMNRTTTRQIQPGPTAVPVRIEGQVPTILKGRPADECRRCAMESGRVVSRFEALARATFDIIFAMTPDWSELRLLDGIEFIPDPAVRDEHWLDRYIPDDERPRVLHAIRDAIEGRTVFDLEHRSHRQDGSIGWIHSRAVPIIDTNDRIVEWIGAAIDITDRRTAAQSIHRRKRHLAAVVETAADAILTVDTSGTILTANAATTRIFGHTVHGILGRHISLLFPDLPPEVCCAEVSEQDDGRPHHADLHGLHRHGHRIPTRFSVSRVRGTDRCVVVIHDVTDQRHTEARLREAERMAAIGTMAAGLGHDMNTILLPIRARLDAIEGDLDPARIEANLAEIRRGIGYLQDLADGLHLLVIDPDGDGCDGATTSIPHWWQRTGGLLKRSLPPNTRLQVHFPDDLPSVAMPPHRLTQVVLNLLSNAGKAIDAGGLVALWSRAALDGRVVVGVSDNGRGMSESVRRRAAEPFFTTRTRQKGTGLGLAMVHGIATTAGGEFEIESGPSGGTTIALTLPAAETEGRCPQESETAPPTAVVDVHCPRTASLLSHLLETEGFDPADPSEAPTAAALRVVDLATWLTERATTSRPAPMPVPPTIVIGHSTDRPDAPEKEGVAYLESNHGFDHLQSGLQSAIERVLPC